MRFALYNWQKGVVMDERIAFAATAAILAGTASALALEAEAEEEADPQRRAMLRLQAAHAARMNDLAHLILLRLDALENERAPPPSWWNWLG